MAINTNAVNQSATYGVAQPSQQWQQQYGQLADQLMPVLYGILSGEKMDGVTPRLAQQLMGVLTPERVANLYERRPEGANVNPNWYQNYIQPGAVSPSLYNTIMDYSSGLSRALADLGTADAVALAGQALQPWQQPTYQVGGNIPTYQQSLIDNAYNNYRMNMSGQEYDPWAGQWRLNNQAQLAAINSALPNYDAIQELGINIDATGNITARDGGFWQNFMNGLNRQLNPQTMRSGMGLQGSVIGATNEYVNNQANQAVNADLQALTEDYSNEQLQQLIAQLQALAASR